MFIDPRSRPGAVNTPCGKRCFICHCQHSPHLKAAKEGIAAWLQQDRAQKTMLPLASIHYDA